MGAPRYCYRLKNTLQSERQSGIWLAKADEWIILAYYDDSKQVISAQIAAARLADEIREDEY
jgi:hypothetical protein